MNQHSDIDRLLQVWMDDGPSTMPDRVLEVVADRIGVQRQRRLWPLFRRLSMNALLKFAAAAAAVLVVAIVGWNLLPGPSGGIGGPSPSPTSAPTPSPTITPAPTSTAIACDGGIPGCAGPLKAGANTTTNFQPALSFVIPAGWSNPLDRTRAYTFYAPGNTLSLQIVSQVAIPEQVAGCTAQRKIGVGNTVADWVTFLTTHPGLVVSAPEPVTVGGYSGMRVTFHVAATWTLNCPRSIAPAVFLITDNGPTPDRTYWIDDQYTTFTILDVAGETVIVHLESAPSPAANARDQQTVRPIIDSFTFSPGG